MNDVNTPIPTNYGYFGEKFGTIWDQLIEAIQAEFGENIEAVKKPGVDKTDLPIFFVKKASAHAVLAALKDKYAYSFLTDYTCTDEQGDEDSATGARFDLVIHLMNLENKARVRIKVKLAENETFPTLIPLWAGANWAEREIYDMFGIAFEGHPDLRRILMDMRWEGHPLRKDYPLRGYQIFLTPEPLDPELLK
jgi:NADH/F420H2 dehydrogenase subunit C